MKYKECPLYLYKDREHKCVSTIYTVTGAIPPDQLSTLFLVLRLVLVWKERKSEVPSKRFTQAGSESIRSTIRFKCNPLFYAFFLKIMSAGLRKTKGLLFSPFMTLSQLVFQLQIHVGAAMADEWNAYIGNIYFHHLRIWLAVNVKVVCRAARQLLNYRLVWILMKALAQLPTTIRSVIAISRK